MKIADWVRTGTLVIGLFVLWRACQIPRDAAAGQTSRPPSVLDCNGNGVEDSVDIANGFSPDSDRNGVPDECEIPTMLPAATVCPASSTNCPPSPTSCPYSQTNCPVIATVCQGDTFCSPVMTICNADPSPTLCVWQATQCPVTSTVCPACSPGPGGGTRCPSGAPR